MKNIYLSIMLITLWVSSTSAQWSDKLQFSAKLDGAQEVPSVSTNAMGVASLMLTPAMDSMCIDISVNGLSGAITGIHIHEAAMGSNGGVITDLTPFVNGNRITGKVALTSNMIEKMMTQMYYLNVHTAANPNGEIRGQIKLETDWMYHAWMDTLQQTHTVMGTNDPKGMTTLHIGQKGDSAHIRTLVTGLSGAITAAHFHYGEAGQAGGVAIDLSSMINGNMITGTFAPASAMGFMDSLRMGKVYINVHTAMNPSGEIRGQVMMDEGYLTFDSWLDTMQQTHTVMGTNNPMGNGYISVNPTMDTLWYDFLFDDLSATPTAAHIHNAMAGMAGGVIVDFSSGINGNRINGMVAGVTSSTIQELLKGAAYVNVHTTLNANGEVRGQAYKHARDGYNLWLSGDQEVPAVTTSAMGSGIVSIDRNKTNAHTMIVLSGLSGSLTGAHFHQAPMGSNGSVVYNLTPWFSGSSTDDSAFGYWTSSDMTTPFLANNAIAFWSDSIYVNIHTAANPSGEIRGQVVMETACSALMTGVEKVNNQALVNSLEVFPSPTTGAFTLAVSPKAAGEYTISINNMLGQELENRTLYLNDDYQQLDFDLGDYDNGIYMIRIRNNGAQQVAKIIKF